MTRLINAFWVCALVSGAAFAQADRGTITGTVTDPSGAIVAGARVSVEHTEAHNILETITSSTGNFTLPQLPVGMWDVTVEAPGFKRFRSLKNTIQVATGSWFGPACIRPMILVAAALSLIGAVSRPAAPP